MAKIDVTKIEGYTDMTLEQKVEALEGYETEAPDYSGYVKKEIFDKASSDLAAAKKQLKEQMSDEDRRKAEEQSKMDDLQSKYDKLLHDSEVAKNKANLVALGYEEALADETAEAMATGDMAKVMANQKKHLDAYGKKIRAEALKDTPKPTGDGNSQTMTLEKLRKMSPQERYEYSTKNPQEYKALYTDTSAVDTGSGE